MCLLSMQCIKACSKTTCCMMRGWIKGTSSTRKLLNFKKPQAKMYIYMYKSISKKQNGKIYRWGLSSNSTIKKASNHQVHRLLRTHTCIQPQRVRILPGTWWFCSTAQAWNVRRTQLLHRFIIAIVPLSFQPDCKSLLSLERQIVLCLQHSSVASDSFWVLESKALATF